MKKLFISASLMATFIAHAHAMSDENSKDEMHCPPKPVFKKLVEENIAAKKEVFEFEAAEKFWRASHILTFNENGEEIPFSEFSTPISQLQLTYEVNAEDETSASAQFSQNNRLVLAIRLDKFIPKPTADGRNIFELNCLNKIQFKNLMEENRDNIATKTDFTFKVGDQVWKASNIQHYNEKGEDCSHTKAVLSLSILQRPLIYRADFNDPSRAVAQFPHVNNALNALVIHLDRLN